MQGKRGHIAEAEQKRLLNLLYYLNSYSQAAELNTLSSGGLQAALMAAREELLRLSKPGQEEEADAKAYASMRLLACMREVPAA